MTIDKERTFGSGFTAVVPIRKGSERIPGKNLVSFAADAGGNVHSLLSWKLRQLCEVLGPSGVLVSTDWDSAVDVATSFGCKVHHRSAYHAAGDTPFAEVISAVLRAVETPNVVWAPATSPLAGPRTIRAFLQAFDDLDSTSRDRGLIAVSELRSYAFLGSSPINFQPGAGHVRTQDLQAVNVFDWALSVRPTELARTDGYMFGEKPSLFSIPTWVNTDVNYAEDLAIAKLLLPLYNDYEMT